MREETRKHIDYMLGSFAIEGLRPSDDAIKLYQYMEDGTLSADEVIKRIEKLYGIKRDKCVRRI